MNYSGEIKSLKDLSRINEIVQEHPLKQVGAYPYYRGHGCSGYRLLSYISRFFLDITLLQQVERKIINDLKQKTEDASKHDFFYVPQNSNGFDQDWYWLTQAQHLGIPTRLLDWSLCSEIALYFAVSDKSCINKNGDLWVFFIPEEFNIYSQIEDISSVRPFHAEKDLFINIPIHWSNNYKTNEPQRNILNQQGKFFIRTLENSLIPLEDEAIYKNKLLRYKIPANYKEHIFQELTELNYSNETICKTIDPEMQQIKNKLLDIYNLKK